MNVPDGVAVVHYPDPVWALIVIVAVVTFAIIWAFTWSDRDLSLRHAGRPFIG